MNYNLYRSTGIDSRSLVLVIAWMACGIQGLAQDTVESNNQPTWKISEWRGGGRRGMAKSTSLDSDGKLKQRNGTIARSRSVEGPLLNEIRKSILDLNLSRSRTKIKKGLRIYDGIYSGLTITLSAKDYRIEGSSFYDEKYVDLTPKQQQVLQKLKKAWKNIQSTVAEEKLDAPDEPPPIMTGRFWTIKVWQRTSLIKYDPKTKREYFVWGEKTELWNGRMTRRGQGLRFDVVWQNAMTGEEFGDEVEMVDAVRERVLLRRNGVAKNGLGKILKGSYEKNRATIIRGKTDLGTDWEAMIETETGASSNDGSGEK